MFYEVDGNIIRINSAEFFRAVRWNWQGKTAIPIAGTSVSIPAWNYDGSGEEVENFDEFTSIPPSGVSIPNYEEWSLDTDGTREEYMEFASENGWLSIREDWEAWIEACIDHLIQTWDPQEEINEEWRVYGRENPPVIEVVFQ